jgi:hypothetical protein
VSKHAFKKHPGVSNNAKLVPARLYYHKGTGKNVAIAEPWIDADGLPPTELSALLGKRFDSWDAWKEEAMVYRSAALASQDIDRVRTALKATKIMPRFEDPGRVLFETKGDEELTQDLETKLKSLGADIDELIGSKMLDWDVKTEEMVDEQALVVRELVERIRLIQNALVTLSKVSVRGLTELQMGVVVRLASLEGILGSFEVLVGKPGFEGVSFAGAIELLQGQLEEIKQAELVKELVEQVMKSSDMLEFSEGLKEAFKRIMRRVLSLEAEMGQLKVRAAMPEMGAPDTISNKSENHNWFEESDRSEGSLLGEADGGHNKGELREVLNSLARRVDAMEQNGGMNSKMEGEDISVFFMGVRFSSERDVVGHTSYQRATLPSFYLLGWSRIATPSFMS